MTIVQIAVVSTISIAAVLLLMDYTVPTSPEKINDGQIPLTAKTPPPSSVAVHTGDKTTPAFEARIAEVEAKFDQLENKYRALDLKLRSIAQTDQRQTQTRAEGSASVREGGEVTVESIQSEEVEKQARLSFLESELARQGVDPTWSKKTTENIVATFNRGQIEGSSLVSATCASTLCRLQVQHVDEGSSERFVDEFFTKLGWQGAATGDVTDHHDGTYSSVLFVSR